MNKGTVKSDEEKKRVEEYRSSLDWIVGPAAARLALENEKGFRAQNKGTNKQTSTEVQK